MSRTHTNHGKRLSSMTHASQSHTCDFCGRVAYGNGGQVSHARSHVRRGEAIELVKEYEFQDLGTGRVFLAPDDDRIAWFVGRGFQRSEPL